MSQPDFESASVPSVINKKPIVNVYSAMLIIALISLLITIIFLAMEFKQYDYDSGSQTASLTPPVLQQEASLWS